jgi:glutamate 5-kinase
MVKKQRFVLKLGTSTLTNGTKTLSRRTMLELVRQAALLHEEGHEIVFVSSGAVAAGREVLKQPRLDASMPTKQMLSSIGQVRLMQMWTELFALYDITVSQVLLTHGDFSNRTRYLNVRDTLSALIEHRVIPIVNENDTVATKEIKVGDNDNLSALVANLIAADLLILLTDQEGLFTADPRVDNTATLIPLVEHIDENIYQLAGGSLTQLGTGGMITKIQAAHLATQSGTPTVVAPSARKNIIADLIHGKPIGTLFKAQISLRESRKRWLLSEKPQGTIHVDAGATKQLSKSGASLLAVGITDVGKTFERGSIIQIVSPEGKTLAVGIASYSSDEVKRLAGMHSHEIERILGYTYGPEIVHRDNMTLFKYKEGAP